MRVIASPTQTPIGNQILSARKPDRIEFTSKGIDEALQGIGSDAWGGLLWPGLRIPTRPTTTPDNRYLFLLCSFTISDGDTARIIGMRNGWSLGFNQTSGEGAGETHRIVEQWVRDPLFKGSDFNVTWHLRKLTLNEPRRPNPSAVFDPAVGYLFSTAFQASDTPALLYQTIGGLAGSPFYTDLVTYIPPNRGRPWGRPLAGLGTFHDIKAEWSNPDAWHALDIPIVGPCRVVLYASVRQSNPSTRQALTIDRASVANFPLGLSPEEQFLQLFPNAIPWRVAGALAVRFEDISPDEAQFRSFVQDGDK